MKHTEDTAHILAKTGKEIPDEIKKATAAQLLHGTIVLKTNKMDFDGMSACKEF